VIAAGLSVRLVLSKAGQTRGQDEQGNPMAVSGQGEENGQSS
jgi:hypothetical protein